jgi:transposase, IS5 family
MTKQTTFSDLEYQNRKRISKREKFLNMMDEIIPWQEWVEIIKPFYFVGKRGRPARGIETMLRMYLLQNWYNLSDEKIEEAIYDSYAMRSFMRINFLDEQAPDATTLLKFRRILEKNHIQERLFKEVAGMLEANGLIMHGGTIVDATIIEAPSSTKNASGSRDPEMCQTKKGNQWHFGMKAHVGVDAGTGYIHSTTATAANHHDITETHNLIRPDDTVVYGDSGYLGVQNRDEIKADPHTGSIDYRINIKPGKMHKALQAGSIGAKWDKLIENRKSSVRSKVEHVFRIIKDLFGFRKVAYKGIYKNLCKLSILFASANLYMCAKAGRCCVGHQL